MNNKNKHIVLIHGLYMPALIMQYLDRNFKNAAFKPTSLPTTHCASLLLLNASIDS